MARRSYYQTLGVSPRSAPQEIHKAYRRNARQCHPDANPTPESLERFYDLQRAYEALRNPKARAGYDMLMGGGMDGAAARPTAQVAVRPLPVLMCRLKPHRRYKGVGPALNRWLITGLIVLNVALAGYGGIVLLDRLLPAAATSAPASPRQSEPGPAAFTVLE